MLTHGCHETSSPEHGLDLPAVAIVGRPNVGKSTLFAAATGRFAETVNAPGRPSPRRGARSIFRRVTRTSWTFPALSHWRIARPAGEPFGATWQKRVLTSVSVPCVATLAALRGEFGWRPALAMCGAMLGIALAVGGILARLLGTVAVTPNVPKQAASKSVGDE